ncbi:BspA family leucine-rich repeat surface protein [Helicobacter sp. 23-1046]
MANENVENVEIRGDLSVDSRESSVDSSVDSTQSTPKLSLSEFLARESIPQNDKGQFMPDKKQLKMLVNCIDDDTGKLISLRRIDTSRVTNMKALFYKSARSDFDGIEDWNVSGVVGFELCFAQCKTFNAKIEKWGDKIANARTFEAMFWGAESFDRPIGAHWDTSSATNMIRMFSQAKSFNNGGEPFGEKWKMDKVGWTWEMFWNAERFNQPINHWKMSSVTKCFTMFMGAKAFNQPLDKWDLSNAVALGSMFNKAESFNQDLSAWGDKLGKAQNMKRMFADTKSLNQTFAWKINENCDITNITKGSPLQLEITQISDSGAESEKEILQDSSQNAIDSSTAQSKKFARNVGEFRIYRVANIPNSLNKLSESKKKDCLYRWIPENIKAKYEIFFAKGNGGEIASATDLDWEFVYYRVFEYCFVVETDEFKLPQDNKPKIQILAIEQRKDDEEFDGFDFDSHKKDYENDDIEVILEDKEHIMRIYNGDTTQTNSYRILNLIGSLILAKAYETKMEYFNKKARDKQTKLTNCHKEICEFDLQYYQNMPVSADLSVLQFWNQLSQRYNIESKHKELKETIKQVAELVNESNQKKFNYIMLLVAIFSAIGAILAAIPVIKGL